MLGNSGLSYMFGFEGPEFRVQILGLAFSI